MSLNFAFFLLTAKIIKEKAISKNKKKFGRENKMDEIVVMK
jgi:hypothetical protein